MSRHSGHTAFWSQACLDIFEQAWSLETLWQHCTIASLSCYLQFRAGSSSTPPPTRWICSWLSRVLPDAHRIGLGKGGGEGGGYFILFENTVGKCNLD